METSSNELERRQSDTAKKHKTSSQLVGLLASRDELNKKNSQKVLDAVAKQCSLDVSEINHATELIKKHGIEKYNEVFELILKQIETRGWQPVRLINKEQISFGERAQTHINFASTLVVKIFDRLRARGQAGCQLNVIPAGMNLQLSQEDWPDTIAPEEYENRIRESIGMMNAQLGATLNAKTWTLSKVQTGSGTRWPTLILCDWISNASYMDFQKLTADNKSKLIELFGLFDFSFRLRELLGKVEFYLSEKSHGLALIAIAKHLVEQRVETAIYKEANELLQSTLNEVAEMPARFRDVQLNQVTSWLERAIEINRDLDFGLETAAWVVECIGEPLRNRLRDNDKTTLDWFFFNICVLQLSACNHKGRIIDGSTYSNFVSEQAPAICRSWQHNGLMATGLIVQAVHNTDRFEFGLAADSMKKLVNCDTTIGELFASEMFELEGTVRSDYRAQAMGTWLQALVLGGKKTPELLVEARQLSDKAIQEFTDSRDVSRQHQYRCQLEIADGNFGEALKHLCKSLGLPEVSHDAVAAKLKSMSESAPGSEGFPLLHWLRLGIAEFVWPQNDTDRFETLVESAGTFNSGWIDGTFPNYPAHGIRRRLAFLLASQNRQKQAQQILHKFSEFQLINKNEVPLALVELAMICEVVAGMWRHNPIKASDLLNGKKNSATQYLKKLNELLEGKLDKLVPVIEAASSAMDEIDRDSDTVDVAQKLYKFANLVDY